jgi:hypothetical protein
LGTALLGPEHRVAKPLYRLMERVRRPR